MFGFQNHFHFYNVVTEPTYASLHKNKATNKPQDSKYKEMCGENRCYYIALYLIEATKEAWLLQTCKTTKIAINLHLHKFQD